MSKNSELFKSMFKLNDYTSLKGNNLFTSKTRYRFNVKKNILLIKEQKKEKEKKRTVNAWNKHCQTGLFIVIVLTNLKTILTNSITLLITTNKALLNLVAAG